MTQIHRMPATSRRLAVILAGVAAAAPVRAADLALTRVMLSTGGVGYVEYSAEVSGPATLGLDVRLDQVDDVLKSLVVFDSAGGVGGIELPGRDAADAAFGDLPFGQDGLASPLDYLNSLRGVELTVTGPRPMRGRLLRAERVSLPVADTGRSETTAQRTRVTLLAADGMRQFVLEDAEAVQVADPALRTRIERALDTLRRDAGSTSRHITLRSTAAADATRQVKVGYVAGAPLWKTSYRLVLPPVGGEKARLQGWAVLENTTGANWDGVELALQYGNPVTFRQALYKTYFVVRPEVPVEILGRILPGVDTQAASAAAARTRAAPPPPAPMPMPMPMQAMSAPAGAAYKADAPVMAAPSEQSQAAEGAEETVFVLPGKVKLAAGHTASVLLLDRDVAARRVGLVQQGRPHPLSSIRITNDSPTSLPAGVLTLYDPSSPARFSGDARLGGLPPGESRLLSFAEDLRTNVIWRNEETASISAITASAGVLRVDERLRFTHRLTLTGAAGEKRDLLIEMPRPQGATLVADNALKPIEDTAAAWRFAVSLAPGEIRDIAVASERIGRQQISLIDDDGVIARIIGRPGVSDAAAAALRRLADLRTAKAAKLAEVTRLEEQVAKIESDEDRIRQNLAAVPANDALHVRLVRQLDAAETRIEALRGSVQQAEQAADAAERAFARAVASFTL
jgi:hypothetical protein